MKNRLDELAQRLSSFKARLKQAGIRLTPQRLEIFKEVAKSGEHPDAEAIHKGLCKRLPNVSLDTVYRTLYLLSDLGLIDILGTRKHRVRFDSNPRAHHHFVCKKCGMISDLYCAEFEQIKIPAAARRLGRVEKAQVEVRGVCLRCSKGNNPKKCAKRKKEEK